MIDPGLILTTASTVAIVLGVIIGVRELRHFSKIRESDVLRVITDKTTDESFLKNFFMLTRMNYKTYDEIEGRAEEVGLFQWLDLLEGLGLLMKRGVVSLSVIDDHLHGAIRLVWTSTEPVVVSYREKYRHPEFGEWAEYLYLRIYGKSKGQEQRASELEKKLYSKRL